MVRRCDLKPIPFNLINSVRTSSGAVIKAKPLDKLNLERTIFTQQFSLRYVVFCKPKSSYKSSSDMLLFKFPTYNIFNVLWELDFCYFVFEGLFEKIHAQIVVDFDKCCVGVKNIVVYVDFVDFLIVVVEHLTFVTSPVFSLDFSLM